MSEFARGTKDDFLRILMGISEEAHAAGSTKALELQTMFTKAGGLTNGRYPITLAAELVTIHRACVDRAMGFTAEFARSSGLDLNELCDAARECLMRRVVVFSTPILKAMNTPSDAAHQSVSKAERKPFEKQIDEGIKNLKVGFVGDKNVAMNPAATIQAKALRLLQTIYDQTRSREEPVFVEQLGGQLGIYIDDIRAAWRYLRDKGLIETFSIPYTARISAAGVDAIEAAQLQPDKTTPLFPSITYNVTIHGTGAGSQVNVATRDSSQISQITGADPAALRQLVDSVLQLVDQMQKTVPASGLPLETREQVQKAVVELEAAATDRKPEPTRLRRTLESLSRMLENAGGDLMALGARLTIQNLLNLPLGGP